MKKLVDYIKEACETNVAASKSLTFNFAGCEGVDDLVKSALEIAEKDGVEVENEENKITVKLQKDALDKADGLFELLQDFINARSQDAKNASDQAYAEKIHKLSDLLTDWQDYAEDAECEEDEKNKEEQKEEDKSDDNKDEE